jgi:hypothetical protein
MGFWITFSHFRMQQIDRGGAEGRYFVSNSGASNSRIVRDTAWGMRSLATAATVYGDDGGLGSDLVACWQYNTAEYAAAFVTGTKYSGEWVNPTGCIGVGSSNGTTGYIGHFDQNGVMIGSTRWADAPWHQAFWIASVGWAWDLGIDQSAQSLSDHQAIRDHGYKNVVGQCGGSGAGEFCYRRFMPYVMAHGEDGVGVPPETWYADWGEMYSELESMLALTPLSSKADGLSLVRDANNAITSTDWSTGYPGNGLPALAYAKEHGATGADAAWTRITGSASWSLTDSAFPNTPVWGVKPRIV